MFQKILNDPPAKWTSNQNLVQDRQVRVTSNYRPMETPSERLPRSKLSRTEIKVSTSFIARRPSTRNNCRSSVARIWERRVHFNRVIEHDCDARAPTARDYLIQTRRMPVSCVIQVILRFYRKPYGGQRVRTEHVRWSTGDFNARPDIIRVQSASAYDCQVNWSIPLDVDQPCLPNVTRGCHNNWASQLRPALFHALDGFSLVWFHCVRAKARIFCLYSLRVRACGGLCIRL